MASASGLGWGLCTLEFSAVLSQRKKEIAAPSPSFPLCPSFQKLLRATQQKGTGSVALPLSPPPSSARAWPPAAAVARARRTVRDVRARAAFASAGDWGTVRSPNGQGSPSHPNGSLLESRKRIRATSRSWREGGWEETGTGLSARLRSLTACFFFPPPVLLVVDSWMRSASGDLPGSVLFSIPSLRAVPGRVLEEG